MTRNLTIGAGALIALLATSLPAFAHITLAGSETPAGSTYRAVLVVGHGCGPDATTQVRVQIPEGFYNVKPMPKAGWELKTIVGPYATPFMNHGTELKEGVTEISWSGGDLPNEQFDEFVFRGTFGETLEAGSTFFFPTIQICGSKEDAWIDTSGDEEAEMPAPSVTLTESSGHHH